jgi:hypothetical protein
MAVNVYVSCHLDVHLYRREATLATLTGRMRKRGEPGEVVRHQADQVFSREIRAGAARLVSASLRERSREIRASRHLPNNFTKSNGSASALTRHQHWNQGNRLTMLKLRFHALKFSFLMLLCSQSIR